MPAAAPGKEEHYAKVRVLLMTEKTRCTSCHASATSKDLNRYGQALNELGAKEPLAERMAMLERGPRDADKPAQQARAKALQDIDGDGVANWVEIMAGTNPADARDKPDPVLRERIEKVVSCSICHAGTNLPGATPLESNPHNELGKLLARAADPKDRARTGGDPKALREAAERVPILKRFRLIAMKPTGSGRPSAWDKLVLFYAPADASATPTREEMKELREHRAQQKNPKTRDPNLGMGPHKPDGFLAGMK